MGNEAQMRGEKEGVFMKKSILIVDDDKSNLIMAQKLLDEQYRVAAVNSGMLALEYLERNRPDLILLDIQMPQMNGFEVMKKIQKSQEWKKIPVIFLTADRDPETEENCFLLGAMDYIGKPFVPTIMLMRIKHTLELESNGRSLEKMVQQQLQQITQIQQDIIFMMANLIESRDGTTGDHVKRTSIFAHMLARKMKNQGIYADVITEEYVEYMRKAAPLHDIGKIMVSDVILQKPGALTDQEYERMKMHAAEGGRLIRENMKNMVDQEFVRISGNMANYHHEKWAGGGYPENRRGEEIPLEARILAVADVFDALAFKRQYKEKMPLDQVFEIMRRERGKSFEPVILDAFLEMEEELRRLIEIL